jgi:hypothetical protein
MTCRPASASTNIDEIQDSSTVLGEKWLSDGSFHVIRHASPYAYNVISMCSLNETPHNANTNMLYSTSDIAIAIT